MQVLFNGSIRYYLLGQFVDPGLKYADRSMRLLEAMSLGGSVILDKASLRRAYLIREGRRLPVNFRSLLRDGDVRQNIWLRGGDTIVVPDNLSEQAFVLGGAAGGNARGGAVPFVNGQLDLLQALAQAGIGFRERAQGRLSQVRIIRSESDRGQFFVVDAERMLRGRGRPVRAGARGHRVRPALGRDHLERGHPADPAHPADGQQPAEPVRADQVPVGLARHQESHERRAISPERARPSGRL